MADTTTPKTGATPGNSPFIFSHTKAPWTAERGCIFAGEVSIAQVFSGAVATQAEADANARLIASAPALLGAMVALMFAALDDDPAVTAQALRQAVAVLALVEGSVA